jgi:hypothetical protein
MGWFEIALLVAVGLYVALRLVLGVLIVVTHLVEKRSICSLVPMDADDSPGSRPDGASSTASPGFNPYEAPGASTPGYVEARCLRAEELGFVCHGRFKHFKGGIYQARYALWESPTRDILAVVIWGTTVKINLDKTILYTPIDGGRFLVTSDKITGVQAPWIFEDELFLGADFDRLVEEHCRRLREAGGPARPFSGPDGLADYRAIRTRLIQSFVDRGEAYYLGPDRDVVRSTLKGAFLAFFRTFKTPKYQRA